MKLLTAPPKKTQFSTETLTQKRKKNSPSLFFSSHEILKAIKEYPEKGISLAAIADTLGVGSDQRKELRRTLRELVEDRKLIKLDRRHYSLPLKTREIVGRLAAHREGYGFLIPEDPRLPDIFLSRKETRDLMHGDRVALRLPAKKPKGPRAPRVLEIRERAHRKIVGRYKEGSHMDYVIPDERRLGHPIQIAKKAAAGAKGNMIVLAEITRYPRQNSDAQGRVIKTLGFPNDPGIDTEIIIQKYDLPDSFPGHVLREADQIPEGISGKEISKRRDLRDLNFLTIDGETARDFDDAVAITRKVGGRFQLWVAIADVAHYVKEGSPLDQEALRRATSVYFPEKALPMLPPRLSNGICSLNPREDRLTMTVAMEIDSQGTIRKREVFPSLIRSKARLTYPMVRQMLELQDRELISRFPILYEDLQAMAELCGLLRKKRMNRGSIDFDLPEPEVVLDVQGRVEEIVKAERHIGHKIVEEFMIAANEAVAEFLAEGDCPALYRVHEPPERKKIEEFKEFVCHLGYPVSMKGKLRPKVFQHLLERVRGKPEEKAINFSLLRAMKQARYSEKNLGHFALGLPHYLHFTSPIRRYPDLVVHRILKELLRSGGLSMRRRASWHGRLAGMAVHTSERERVAMEAEREIVDRKKVQFMKDKIGQRFGGYISGVAPFGIFVELKDYFIEGLVHRSRLPEDDYHFQEIHHTLVGERRRRQYRLGDAVTVKVEAADLELRQIDFSLVE